MSTDWLFKNFEDLVDSPERIPALRRLILAHLLHSAVNAPNASTRAAELRDAHIARRRELSKKANRKDAPSIPNVTDEDLPPSLSHISPDLFERLGNVAQIDKGLSQIQSTRPGKYPLVVTAENRSSSDSFDFEGAAAIVPLVSSTGHGDASLKRIHYQEGRYAVGNILAVVRPICPELLRARFIYEYLSAFKEELLVSRMVGTANVSLTINKLKEVPVPLVAGPVLNRIDELMALCDRLEAEQQERETRQAALSRASLARFADAPTPANLQLLFQGSFSIPPADLRKSILTLAVQGKLVPQDPNDEPAEETLRSCKVDLRRWAVARDEERQMVPESWTWVRFAGVGEQRLGKMLDAQKNRGELKPYLRNTNVQWMRFELEDVKDMRVEEREEAELRLKTGDLLICEGGEPGRCAIWRDEVSEMYFQKAIHRVRPCNAVLSEFLALNLQMDCANGVLAGYFTGATIKHLTGRSLASYPIPVPPLAEQRRIVAKVDELMTLVDSLETQLATARTTAARLLEAALADLTTTAPADESDSLLLAAEAPAYYGQAAEIIDLQSSPEFIRATLAAEIADRLRDDRYFGQVKLQKILYLAEYLFELSEIDSHPFRDAAGPHDPKLISQVEKKMRDLSWFREAKRASGKGHCYQPLEFAGAQRSYFEKYWPKQSAGIRQLIDTVKNWDTERSERFATLYAAWNDLLIWRKPTEDEAIIDQVWNHWHPSKRRITKPRWLDMLEWIKREGYAPTGWGIATQVKPQDELF